MNNDPNFTVTPITGQPTEKASNKKTVLHILYGLHTFAWLSGGVFAVAALVANYVLRADETNVLYVEHHSYMITTFWWTLLWLVVLSPLWLLLVIPGMLAYTVVGLWYLYRCIKGWLRLDANRSPVDA